MSRFTNISLFLLIMSLMVSCTSSRTSLTYFEDLKGQQSGTLSSADYDIKVIPDDELFIVVSSLVPEATAEFNLPTVNPAVRGNVGTPSQQSQITYLVDKAGDINFPGLGTLHVGGLTTAQIASIITKKVSETVEDPYVKVQLVNFKVNVLGEVARPGTIEVDTERYSLLDALAAAGDLTPYGERENILLIREENGQKHFHHLNLNDAATLSSPYFYLQQNDVIYVEPNKIRHDNSKYNQNNSYKLSVVSAVVSAVSVVASLCIALFIK